MNRFEIVISATDRVTNVVRKINNSMARLTRPITQVGRSVKVLGNTMGFDRVAAGLMGVGRAAAGVFQQLNGMLGPLLTLTSGGIIAGIIGLAMSWSALAFNVERASAATGVSVQQLQTYRGVARLAGLGVDAMTSSIMTLGNTMEDALFGRNQQALLLMNRLGITVHYTKDGLIDTTQGFNDLARAISRIRSPQVQQLVARQFGIEAMLPVLRQGEDGIKRYAEMVKRLGYVQSDEAVANATRFQDSLNATRLLLDSTKQSIGDRLLPVLMPLLEQFNRWLFLNREIISTKIAEYVKDFSIWLPKAVSVINDVVNAFGGWRRVLIGLGVIMTVNALAPTALLAISLGNVAVAMAGVAVRGLALTGWAAGAAASFGLLNLAIVGVASGVAGLLGFGIGTGFNKLFELIAGDSLGIKLYNWTHADQNINGPPGSGQSAQTPAVPLRLDTFNSQPVHVNITAPPGTKVDVKRANGGTVPTRISYTMPTTVTP